MARGGKVLTQESGTLERRIEAVEYAVASQRIEGLVVCEETIEDMRRIARGEITTDQAREALFRRYGC